MIYQKLRPFFLADHSGRPIRFSKSLELTSSLNSIHLCRFDAAEQFGETRVVAQIVPNRIA